MILDADLLIATSNWANWQSVFEHRGPLQANPLLATPKLWARFLHEYSVRRTIRTGTSETLRQRLSGPSSPLPGLIADGTGKTLDLEQDKLRAEFGTHSGRNGLISAMSKVAAFVAPNSFVAWDRFSRPGLNLASGSPKGRSFASYAEYLGQVKRMMAGEIGLEIRRVCHNRNPTPEATQDDRFHLRVLDVCLMRLGGRTF